MRAFWLSKFNLAERSFKKAVEINPNGEAAQLMLINLLRFRNRDAEAYTHIQQGLKKHPSSAPLHKDLVISLQGRDPSRATEQAFLVNCIQNGIIEKIPTLKQDQETEAKKSEKKDQNEKNTLKKDLMKSDISKNKKSTNKKSKEQVTQIGQPKEESQTAGKAVYEPVSNIVPQSIKAKKAVSRPSVLRQNVSRQRRSEKMPAGLVPPPPPSEMLGFPSSGRSGMRARAGSIKLENAQPAQAEPTEERKKHVVDRPAGDADPDFLIEWASVKKKRP